MERHKCKICTRSFSNGRALGGHMKAHLAAHPLPPKLTQQQQLSKVTESASSSSSGEELEMKGKSRSPEVADEKCSGYRLRNNPKKSFRFADPEFSFAVDCGSLVLQDRESESESRNRTRIRSDKNRKLFTAHQDYLLKPESKKKLSCLQESPVEPEPVSSVSDTSPEEDVAMCLMMLSRGVWIRINDDEEVPHQKNVEIVEESKEIRLTRRKNLYEKCKKVFQSYNVLGLHNKVCETIKTKKNDQKMFKCLFYYDVFDSGQAVGGHMRSHLIANSSSSTIVVAQSVKFHNNLIDLNLPPALEEDN